MRVAFVIPAYQAAASIADVVQSMVQTAAALPDTTDPPVLVVDDGSSDATAERARAQGAEVIRHPENRGKGSALLTGLSRAATLGARVAVTLDADGQHPSSEAAMLARHPAPEGALVLGVRDLLRDGAPRANRFSNAFSNAWISWFSRRRLGDTQCGLRRYPLPEILDLDPCGRRFELEAEVIIKAARRGIPMVEVPVRVLYPTERKTHFHSVRDPARIVARILQTAAFTPWNGHGRLRRWLTTAAMLIAGLGILVAGAHLAIGSFCRPEAPSLEISPSKARREGNVRRLGESFVLRRDRLFEAYLTGSPASIGYASGRLFYPEMVENEGRLLGHFHDAIPSWPLRTLLLDLAQLRYRSLSQELSNDRRNEIAASALAFQPDPYANVFPTFQRFVYLNALYDIALSFERSPLLGCTTFTFSGDTSEGGGAILARAFDFEVDPIFDDKKAVFFVRETGRIPFASVAWPGLIGVVSGMNAEGLAVVVHGARAGQPRTEGTPVVHALRRVLSRARSAESALEELRRLPPLVSHIVILADHEGEVWRVERIPGEPDRAVRLEHAHATTNHFEGPAANDPKNLWVRKHTSTLARKTRADELIRGLDAPVDPARAVELLRDRAGPSGEPIPLGDRRAIDALIATHGVVMSTRDRTLWVSEGPHLLGRFVAYDLSRFLQADRHPDPERKLPSIGADPLLSSLRDADRRANQSAR